MKEIKYVTNILHLTVIGSQSLKNININVYYGGPLVNLEEIDRFPFRESGIECYYMMIRRKLKTLNDLKRKIMEELNLNPACYDIKIIYRYPQEVLHERINYGYMAIKEDKHVKLMFNMIHKMPQVNAAQLYVSSEPLAEVDTKEVQQTTTSLQFTARDDGCTTMGDYTMGSYMLPSQIHAANTGETFQPQETHLGEEDEDEDEDHAAYNGENIDDMDEYEERIEQGDFDRDVDDHELVPNFEEENMDYHDEDGKMMDSNFVASEIVGKLQQNHTTRIHDLWEIIRTKYDHELSYYKVWDAKQKVVAKTFGDWEGSYQRLRKLLLAYLDQDSGTQYNYYTIPRGIDGTALLRYVFWAFAPCIAAFGYCRPMISIDGTHLYGKYRGVLMIAMATDANQKVLPLAFAVVDKESGASWRWFLECLRVSIQHVIPKEGICIISGRHKGIKYAIVEWPIFEDEREQVYHRYCLRHVASNFNTHFDDPTLKALALKAGYATHAAKFESLMQTIKDVEINALRNVEPDDPHIARYMPYTYLTSEDVEKWTQSHDGGRRYGAMKTNISECFNGVLKGARSLPIAAMVEFTWCKLVAYFHDRHKQITSDRS
ncbi:hypothetical protein SO802_034512 [Lithocarpus litseifolius]|uniref:MULE transposase domain-containing protein n=1 Tax=Lithocarpus litseifolius TaxID=425828 RepID=A0AAW2BGU7_9ROSI